ncbi:cell division protein FtsZ [Breznakia sp. PF5-3]|uniref:cell division protein FtsZ n=1 Tax=unclassified Breznakia TaxID=2623764 RepID=UPI0024077684|nr:MULTISPECIES: cell division protein FtsZ [unclassified Breznakia]MDF9825590.1 cell division protein FtsZ [Breznakia sp. PM6-1]MDF9836419.1 cell division protein FtsZ [Breznakia sp. PF5-3]MDF9838573.1 cell division protein FtsZ [Breznakia sp. PFB2-8]MDF9860580.1 cell division protein FtsZ [Breznakia sp. PH5-24]
MSDSEFKKVVTIKVFGVGGGGCNAVNRMVNEGVQGVEFYVANTDLQVLGTSPVKNQIVLGMGVTKGQGAGSDPEIGRKAALETEGEIREAIKGSDMVFITAGLGGGTGTGAAPLFAKIAKEEGALTVGIVTKPFSFEGGTRAKQAETGLEELKDNVDSLIIVSNNNLLEVIGRKPLIEAFEAADNVLRQGVQTITDLIAAPALINLDFADVKTIMKEQGKALIGVGMAEGEEKAKAAAEKAIQSPLLEAQITGAKKAIINITGGETVSLYDADDATQYIKEAAGGDIDTIFGVAINPALQDRIIVTVIATGFEEKVSVRKPVEKEVTVETFDFTPKSTTQQEVKDATLEVEDVEEDDGIPVFFKKR